MTNNPMTTHPEPPVDLSRINLYDTIDLIAAGIGGPMVKNKARSFKPNQNVYGLAVFILEAATGVDYDDKGSNTPRTDYTDAYANVKAILDDLPRSVWNRVCDLLHDGRPDAALRVIQAHHNVVQSLSDPNNQTYGNDAKPPYGEYIYDPTPITESWVGEIDDTPDSGSGEPQLVLKAVEPRHIRDGYTYLLHKGIKYGPVPVNELDPPMVHRDKHPRFSPPYTEEFGGKPLVPSFS